MVCLPGASSKCWMPASATRSYASVIGEALARSRNRIARSQQQRTRPGRRLLIERDGARCERRFDPYTGEDLGAPFPDAAAGDEPGSSICTTTCSAARLVGVSTESVAWHSRSSWLPALYCGGHAAAWRARFDVQLPRPRRWPFLLRLHSSFGIWSLPLLLVWGITAAYFGFPSPVEATIEYFDSDPLDFERPGEGDVACPHCGALRTLWTTACQVCMDDCRTDPGLTVCQRSVAVAATSRAN